MKNCPLKIDEDECERCHWNFGRDQCGIFSMAADLSVLAEEAVKQTKMLAQIEVLLQRSGPSIPA